MTVFERGISFIQKQFALPLYIKTETDFLTSSFSQLSLFKEDQESSLTLIPYTTDKIIPHLNQLKEGIFIFTSDKARATSKLVTHFTNAPQSLAIAAYASPLTAPEFESMVKEINLSTSFKDDLFKTYQNNYIELLCILQKVKLFGEISEIHYDLFLEELSSFEGFTFLRDAFLLKDVKKVTNALFTFISADLITFLRSLVRSFSTLFDLMPYKNTPKMIPWQKITPSVFFKDYPLFECALSHWTKEEVKRFLEILLFLEYKVKYSAFTPPQVFQNLLTEIVSRETI